RARFARIISGGENPAAERRAGIFEPANVITLPAMKGNWNRRQFLERGFHIHAQLGVTFTGISKPGGVFAGFGRHSSVSFARLSGNEKGKSPPIRKEPKQRRPRRSESCVRPAGR